MDGIPEADEVVAEYLLFRGFTRTLRAFNADKKGDRTRRFQVHTLSPLVKNKIQVVRSQVQKVLDEMLFYINSQDLQARDPGTRSPCCSNN